MKLASPFFSTVIEVDTGEVFSLVLENPHLMRKYIEDISNQLSGEKGEIILSENNTPVEFSRYAEMLTSFAPFDMNTKSLLTGINSIIEKKAVDGDNFAESSAIITTVENWISDLCFDLPFRAECRKLTIQSLLKSVSVSVCDDGLSETEKTVLYMQTVSDTSKKKLFITLNMRSFFDDDEIKVFADEVIKKQLSVLMIDSHSDSLIPGIKHLTVDKDLCEF